MSDVSRFDINDIDNMGLEKAIKIVKKYSMPVSIKSDKISGNSILQNASMNIGPFDDE